MNSVYPESSFLFVYGTLQPGEIAYPRVEKFVDPNFEIVDGKLPGYALHLRKGFPVAVPERDQDYVTGKVLTVQKIQGKSCFDELASYENDPHYDSVTYVRKGLTVNLSSGQEVICQGFVAERKLKDMCKYESTKPWSTLQDPLLTQGVPVVEKTLASLQVPPEGGLMAEWPGYWDSMMPLQGAYLSLISVIERLASLRSSGSNLGKKQMVAELYKYEPMRLAINHCHIQSPFIRYSLEGGFPRKQNSRQLNLREQLYYWYNVRSNLAHQGKSSLRDYEILYWAASDLARVLTSLCNQ